MSEQSINLQDALAGQPQKRNWGATLERFGAGLQGNLAQFDSARTQQELLRKEDERLRRTENKALSLERAQAAAQDAQIALQFLQAGATDKAINLIDNRLEYINKFGGDPSDTQAVRDLIAANKIEEAIGELSLFTTAAESRGLIKPLITEDERIKGDKLKLDRAEFEAKYGTSAPPLSGPTRVAQASTTGAPSGGMGGGIPSAGGGSFGGTEGAKLRLDQQRANIEAARARREQLEFEAKQKDIPEQYLKLYTESSDAERAATQRAAEMTQLASDFEALGELEAGTARAGFNEAAKKFFGEQDSITALRERFQATRNSVVVRNLPPGAASDADIALALEGVPGNTATKENIASFLRGQAKLAALDASYNRFKAGHIEGTRSIRGINEAWRKEAETVFESVKKEIDRPLNRSYTIEAIDAELAKRGK